MAVQVAALTVPSVLPDSQTMSNRENSGGAAAAAMADMAPADEPGHMDDDELFPAVDTEGLDAFESNGAGGTPPEHVLGASQTGDGGTAAPPAPAKQPDGASMHAQQPPSGVEPASPRPAQAQQQPDGAPTHIQQQPAGVDPTTPRQATLRRATARTLVSPEGAPAARVRSAGARLSLSRAKPAVDDDATTLPYATYRAFLMDRTPLLRAWVPSFIGSTEAQAEAVHVPLGTPASIAHAVGTGVPERFAALHARLAALYARAEGHGSDGRGGGVGQAGTCARAEPAQARAQLAEQVQQGGAPEGLAGGVRASASCDEPSSPSARGGSGSGSPNMTDATMPGGVSDDIMEDVYLEEGLDVFEESRQEPDAWQTADDTGCDGADLEENGLTGSVRGAGSEAVSAAGSGGSGDHVGLMPRTRALLQRLQSLMADGVRPGKRARTVGGGVGCTEADDGSAQEPALRTLLLSEVLQPVSEEQTRCGGECVGAHLRGRAAQAFYDTLVLQNRGYVQLQQLAAYGDICVLPRDLMLS